MNISCLGPVFYSGLTHSVAVICHCFRSTNTSYCGPGSSVGIVTGYGLDGPGIESRWGARFSAPVQIGPGSHPTSCTLGTGSFPGVKSSQGVR